jgi:hypothetical protein
MADLRKLDTRVTAFIKTEALYKGNAKNPEFCPRLIQATSPEITLLASCSALPVAECFKNQTGKWDTWLDSYKYTSGMDGKAVGDYVYNLI